MSDDTFASWLRRQLSRREWSAADFARKMGIRPGVVSHWLTGERIPSTKSIDKIADVLGVDLDMLLAMTGHRPATEPIDPDDPRNELIGLVKRIDVWPPGTFKAIRVQLEGLLEDQRAARKGKK